MGYGPPSLQLEHLIKAQNQPAPAQRWQLTISYVRTAQSERQRWQSATYDHPGMEAERHKIMTNAAENNDKYSRQ